MKRILLSVTLLVAVIGLVATIPAYAQEAAPMTDEHIARIKNNCQSALAIVSQIRTNDGPVFVNRNQAYFSISDKLIARLNSRLALGSFDTTPLVKVANEYNGTLTDLRNDYRRYNDAMVELVRMDCSRQPVSFFDKTKEVRELRQSVHADIVKLRSLIEEYRKAVDTFEAEHSEQLRKGKNA